MGALSAIALLCLGLASCVPGVNAFSGVYTSGDGSEFNVRTDGPSALSVVAADGLCLMFWRSKKPMLVDGVETLRGQECSNGKFGDLDWSAAHAENVPNRFTLYPPRTFRGGKAKPLIISLKQKSS